jgi:pSer/pThr/pTyr-binding forkhead associated (FHA) protein
MKTVSIRWETGSQTQTITTNVDGELKIGRLSGCDLVIPHQTVSREHAMLVEKGDALLLRNLSGTNPIRLNSQKELQAKEEAPLNDGDMFQLGVVNVLVTFPDLESRLKFKIKCTNCGEVVDNDLADCPWCGTSLAFGETYIPVADE